MTDLTSTEMLQPSLLDRLTDDEPGSKVESREQRVLSMARLRQAVLRDLTWLLNCGNMDSTDDFDQYPAVQASVLNFGVRDLTGCTASSLNPAELEERVREAILRFEPRIVSESVTVRMVDADSEGGSPNTMSFEIEGELWALPMPVQLFLRTDVDLETGSYKIIDSPR